MDQTTDYIIERVTFLEGELSLLNERYQRVISERRITLDPTYSAQLSRIEKEIYSAVQSLSKVLSYWREVLRDRTRGRNVQGS